MRRLLRKFKKRFYPLYWSWKRRKESLTHGLPPYSEILLEEKKLRLALADAERMSDKEDIAFINGKLDALKWLKRYGTTED